MIPVEKWSAFTVWWESGLLEAAFVKMNDGIWERNNSRAFSKYGVLSVGLDDDEIESEHDRIWLVKIAEIRTLKAKRREE